MPRVMTIWLPRWPVQRRLVERPELRKLPVFVCRREQRGIMRVVSWAWAEPPRREPHRRRAAIQPGMPLAEAMAVLALAHGSRACHIAAVEPDDPVADRLLLERVGRWCRRFAPAVGVETVPAGLPEAWTAAQCLHLDVTGTAGFFGGEAALARTAAWTLAARGLHARVAIADTPAAAWAAAHHTHLVAAAEPAAVAPAENPRRRAWGGGPAGRRWAVVPSGAQRLARGEAAVLAGLPLVALRLEAGVSGMLEEVGIDTIGGVLRLPAKSLAARFPGSLAVRLAEFTGDRAEPIAPARECPLPQARHDFELPLPLAAVDESLLARLLEPLVGRCLEPLVARGEGLTAVQVRLDPAAAIHVAAPAPPTVIDVGLFRPSLSVRHVVELVRLRMGRMRLPREIESLAVEVVAAGPAACRQRGLFEADAGGRSAESRAADVAGLLDRLAGRLGRTAVFQPQPVADPQPEHAWIAAPPAPPGTAPPRTPAPRTNHATAGRRPVWMPARPLPLEPLRAGMIAVVPDGPPVRFRLGGVVHTVAAAHGPERIETAWWRGPTVRRDYYVVETESGARFWLFRRLGSRAARGARSTNWYVHGVFA
jgi:protein ImuB